MAVLREQLIKIKEEKLEAEGGLSAALAAVASVRDQLAVCERHNQELKAQVADLQTQSSGARERADSLQETMNCKQELTAFANAELEGQLSAAKVASADWWEQLEASEAAKSQLEAQMAALKVIPLLFDLGSLQHSVEYYSHDV